MELNCEETVQDGISRAPEKQPFNWMQEEFISELTSMWLYLEFAFAVPKQVYEITYFGQKKDLHRQLLCHAIHEMRHAEMLARIMLKWGGKPKWQLSRLPQAESYRDFLNAAMSNEARNLESYQLRDTEVGDHELKVLLANLLREDNAHLQVDQAIQQVLTAQGVIDGPLPPPRGNGQFGEDIKKLEQAAWLEIKSISRLIYASLLLGMDQSIAPRARALAIEDMQHLNRIAQEITTTGGRLTIPGEVLELEESDDFAKLLQDVIGLKNDKVRTYKESKPQFNVPGGGQLLGTLLAKEEENIVDLEAYLQSLKQYPLTVH
ncbi:ferritin-like domain-containing protein [Zhaonella formicivorans]|uniref:ferritin-like domain-containing protein n=1 Tax=Zhaonella formicivorans TaxID=2528593 RepID=UPI0010EFCBAE|nr:ferritin-like domain-containing protein [Zhaonella formicivorans]